MNEEGVLVVSDVEAVSVLFEGVSATCSVSSSSIFVLSFITWKYVLKICSISFFFYLLCCNQNETIGQPR